MRSTFMTGAFWAGAFERSFKTAAQSILALWVTDKVVNAFEIDYKTGAGVALAAALLSILTSVVSAPIGPSGPSMVNDRPATDPVPAERSTLDPAPREAFRTSDARRDGPTER